jgi:hypothetical protein
MHPSPLQPDLQVRCSKAAPADPKKFRLPTSGELFDRAYAYIRGNY